MNIEGGPPSSASEHHQAGRLRQLVETCQDAVIFIDHEGWIRMANPSAERIFGYDPGELVGTDVRNLMGEPYATNHRAYVDHYEETGQKRAIGQIRQVMARRKNGHEFPIELSVTQLADEGDGSRYGAFIRDVSEKVKLQSELMERERAATLGTTASMLVHEIGNPLNNMALQLQALRRRVAKHEGAEDSIPKVDACLSEIERLSRLVQEFRALSGRRRIIKKSIRLTKVIESVLANMTRFASEVQVKRVFEDEELEVMADSDKIQQVLLNLCHNAIEAMPNGGTLTLRTRKSATDFVLEVGDTGTGIAPGLEIFEPFVTSKADGTGLGLAICSEIIREHGGTIAYETTEGEGTVFRIRLPLKDHEAPGRP
jgi:two-component system, LuxR family, sensor kinase FixL